jgi:hypothetical protein
MPWRRYGFGRRRSFERGGGDELHLLVAGSESLYAAMGWDGGRGRWRRASVVTGSQGKRANSWEATGEWSIRESCDGLIR